MDICETYSDRKLFCNDWEFYKAAFGSDYSEDFAFKPVDIPHDWLIYNTNDLYETSTGWYRKAFSYQKKEGIRTFIRFDGVYMDSKVYVNGALAGEWKYGYSAFMFDITDLVKDGENIITVRSPFAVARYYQVPLWSQEHLDAIRPLMKMLADAGQKIVTATLTHKPWNGQTEDYFETMVTWMKRADGTWAFDYTVFDRWVEFMMSVGIDQQINCYSMVPWELSFQYFDQATNSLKFVKTAPGEPAYEEMWVAMLTSFSRHLREKGWFDICAIAMDERPMDVMQKTLKVIRKADPEFKVSLAGNYHAEIEPDLYDYCITIGQNFPEEVRLRRAAENKRTTYYTCCTEAHPNTFTFSDPAEAAWMSFYSSKKHLDGYLRWAYNSWPLEPLLDSRFRTWAAGDTYLVYPGARSCIRFERLIEGIQAHEKITILRQEFEKKGNKAGLKKIEKMLAPFNLGDMPEIPAAVTVNRANQILNSF